MTDSMRNLSHAVKISRQILDNKEQLQALPAKVRELELNFQNLKIQYDQKKALLDKTEKEKHQLEQEFAIETENLASKEERLNTLKTQKEFQAVTREISLAKTANRDREDRIGVLSAQVSGLSSEVTPLGNEVQNLEAEILQEKSLIQGNLDNLAKEIAELEISLTKNLEALPDDMRSQYRRIEAVRQPPAALLMDGTCQECYMNVPPQVYIEMKRKKEIFTCPSCHRLLYLVD